MPVAVGESTWLDAVPGARSAYAYMMEKLAEFNLIGTQKIPLYESFTQVVTPIVQGMNDATATAKLNAVRQGTSALRSGWDSLQAKIQSALTQLRSVGLGQIPWGTLLVLGTVLVTVGGGMYLFFQRAENHDALVRTFANELVASGKLSADRATQLLAGGGSGLGSLGTGLTVLALVAGAMYFFPRSRRV